jgi:four helix bundle protein
MMFKFERLTVWQRSVDLYVTIRSIADALPMRAQHSLADQLRRAALSISANIAEGTGREGTRESKQFFNIAKASVYEVVSLLEAATRSGQLGPTDRQALYARCDEIARMLSGLLRH